MCCVNVSSIFEFTQHVWALPITELLCYKHFKRGNVFEIRNRIMFNFYPGLPHIYLHVSWVSSRHEPWTQSQCICSAVYEQPVLFVTTCTVVSCKYTPPLAHKLPLYIYSTKSCWGIFIPHISPPPQKKTHTHLTVELFQSLSCLPLKCLSRTWTAQINDGHASYFAEGLCFLAPQC